MNKLEEARLAELRALEILDTPSEVMFDELTQLAADVCEAPVAAISLVDRNRQWFKSRVGLDVTETSRDVAFCHHAIQQAEIFEVEDAAEDPRFAANPLVLHDPRIRFYAGKPLQSRQGHRPGTLCVIDFSP